MTDQTYTVQVQRDFLERQAAARPIQALAELDGNLYAYDMEIIEDSIQKFRASDQKEIARNRR